MVKPSRKQARPIRVKNSLRSEDKARKRKDSPPGRSLESVENQMVELAMNLAKEQLKEGTASAQVITHFLKLGSSQARLETEKLRNENRLLDAKTESLKSHKKVEELYADALQAMRTYSGNTIPLNSDSTLDDEED